MDLKNSTDICKYSVGSVYICPENQSTCNKRTVTVQLCSTYQIYKVGEYDIRKFDCMGNSKVSWEMKQHHNLHALEEESLAHC